MIDIEKIKKLRTKTGISLSECKKALEKAEGDLKKAEEILKEKQKELAQKKEGRLTKTGIIDVYLHPNKKIGAILEIHCESDFVARNQDFQKLAHEICLQITAMNPQNIKDLLNQSWIKDEKKKIKDLIEECISKFGEKIKIERFLRYEI